MIVQTLDALDIMTQKLLLSNLRCDCNKIKNDTWHNQSYNIPGQKRILIKGATLFCTKEKFRLFAHSKK
jgi:hypothetical protein